MRVHQGTVAPDRCIIALYIGTHGRAGCQAPPPPLEFSTLWKISALLGMWGDISLVGNGVEI